MESSPRIRRQEIVSCEDPVMHRNCEKSLESASKLVAAVASAEEEVVAAVAEVVTRLH